MKRDIKYIIKRIIVGVGIALLLGAIRGYALEDPLAGGNNNTPVDKADITSIEVKDYYVNWYNGYEYALPSSSDYTGCYGKVKTSTYYPANDFAFPSYPSTPFLGSNWSCSEYSKRYVTLGGIKVTINYNFVKDKYYKINLWYMKEKEGTLTRAPIMNNSFMADPLNINITHDNTIENYGGSYGSYTFLEGPYNQTENSSWWDWLGISYIFKVNQDTSQVVIWYGYNPDSTIISGNVSYPSTFTNSTTSPLILYNTFQSADSMNRPLADLTHTRPFLYEYVVENPSIQIPDFSSMAEDTLSDINDDITSGIQNGTYQTQNDLDVLSGGGGGISFGNNNLSDILIVPLRFLQKLNSDSSCTSLELPFPIGNTNFYLPCMSTFFIGIMGNDIFEIVQLILGVALGFKICMSFYYTILNLLDPTKMITN